MYKTKTEILTGTDYHEVYTKAYAIYKLIKARSKRRSHIRSVFFKKDKIFLGPFWEHLNQKKWQDRFRRLKFFPCALELVQKSKFQPESRRNPNNTHEILHRFAGITHDNESFFVQIKENIKTRQKYLLSVFPNKK